MAKTPLKSRKKSYKKRTNMKTKVGVSAAAVKQIAKAEVHRNLQNKESLAVSTQLNVQSSSWNSALNPISCIPYNNIVPSAGTQQGRIGNQIRTMSCFLNFTIYPNPYSAASNPVPTPQIVIMMLGKVKNSKPQLPIASDFAKLWQDGSSSRAPYGDLRDLLMNVNKDYFTVYKVMKFKVGHELANGTGGSNVNQHFANNDFKYNTTKRMNITKYCPSILKFNDNTIQPTNDGLWLWYWCVAADGFSAVNTAPLSMFVTQQYSYENA